MNQQNTPQQSSVLTDLFDRTLNYLRIAVTDRCNFRCTYCMPVEGIPFKSHDQIMRYEEILRIVQLLVPNGLKKIRITGGEPLVRKGVITFLKEIRKSGPNLQLHLTTNGALLSKYIKQLEEIGLNGINLSLDTLRPNRFFEITRRDEFHNVWHGLELVLQSSIPLKLNMVVQRGVNDDEILSMARLTEENPLEVRFIEQMPFDGFSRKIPNPMKAEEILAILKEGFPQLYYVQSKGRTAERFQVPGFKGSLGIIAGYSRTFCATCNRLRLTSDGFLKTCLYDKGRVNLRDLIRNGFSDQQILQAINEAIGKRFRNGFLAERANQMEKNHSMAQIGG